MKGYVLGPESERELLRALVRHEREWAAWGFSMHAEMMAAFELIGSMPEGFAPWRANMRFYVLPRSPYVIYYRNLPDVVWIVGISHTRSRPRLSGRKPPPR